MWSIEACMYLPGIYMVNVKLHPEESERYG